METRPIEDEAAVIARLAGEGFDAAVSPARLAKLRLLAERGHKLRRRYLNSCNHVWATTEHYEAGTEELEDAIRGLAGRLGLHCYIQGDPRGATVYVSPRPISETGYSMTAVAIYPEGARL